MRFGASQVPPTAHPRSSVAAQDGCAAPTDTQCSAAPAASGISHISARGPSGVAKPPHALAGSQDAGAAAKRGGGAKAGKVSLGVSLRTAPPPPYGGPGLVEALRGIDSAVGHVWKGLPANTLLIVASAHGDLAEADRRRVCALLQSLRLFT
jgi:hypothetical protein